MNNITNGIEQDTKFNCLCLYILQESRILDPKYFQQKQQPEEESYDTEFRSKPPKKLSHVVSYLQAQQ